MSGHDAGDDGPDDTGSDEREPRSAAEWTTFAISCCILLVVVGLITAQFLADDRPAAPVATVVGPVRAVGGLHHVDVDVTNKGTKTAANVQVSAELVIDGEPIEADQTIDFLAGHETEHLVFVFDDDPADGELAVTVTGFSNP